MASNQNVSRDQDCNTVHHLLLSGSMLGGAALSLRLPWPAYQQLRSAYGRHRRRIGGCAGDPGIYTTSLGYGHEPGLTSCVSFSSLPDKSSGLPTAILS